MSTSVGQLTIEMAANIARLEKDMRAARKSVDQAMGGIQKSAQFAMNALSGIAVGLSVNAFAGWIKGAIDAMDKTEELSQKVGISVEQLGGLQLAFKMGGVEAGALQLAMSKLSTGIAEGNNGLKAMGIQLKNTDGSAKTTRDIFGEIADKFENYADGAQKTALAIEVFGKSGADLLPILNGGSESLAEFDAMAKKLGITLDTETAEKAAQFNDTLDLVGVGFQGLAQNLAAQILPALQDLADRFFEAMSEGDRMEALGKTLGLALKGLGAAAIAAADGFKILGLYMGGYAGAFSELISGNFSKAYEIISQTGRSVITTLQNSVADIGALFSNTGDNTVKNFARITSALKNQPPAFGAAAEAAKKAADEYAKMIEKADELVASLEFETRSLEMNSQERETAIQLRKLEAIGIKEGTAEYEKYAQAIMDTVAINESIKERLKLEEELQKERIKQEEDYAKEVERINDQIGQSLADALMEGGKSAKDFLIGMFKTMVLRPLLQPMITGVVGAMGFGAAGAAMAGTTGAGGAAGGSMNLMSMGSALKSAYELVTGSFTSLGAAVSDFAIEAGFQMMSSGAESAGIAMMESAATLGSVASYLGGIGAGLGLGNLISGGKSIGGSSWIGVGGGTAIGSMVGGPIGAAVGGILGGVINAAFGSGAKEYTDTGITGTLSAMAADVEEYSKWKKAGGWFTSTKRGTEFRALNSELQGTLDAALRGIGGSVAYFARSLGQPTDAINSFSQSINISFKDLSEQEIQQKIQEAVSGFEAGLIAAVFPSLSTFAYAGESAGDTLKRLSDRLSMVNKVFEALGFRLNEISLSGADAANKLVELTGGIDAFTQKVDFYYQNFYSVQERLNKNTDQLTSVFSELGMMLPTTREAFRAIVDVFQQSGSTTLLATMLNIAGAFNEYITAVEQAEQRTVEIMLARMQEGATIENRLLQALNQVSELRNRELNALDESNRALQQHVYGLEDAQNAYSSAVEATNQAFDQLKQAISVELQSALNALTKDFEDFTDSITQQQQALESAQQVANQNLNSLKGLFDFIGNQIDDLVGSTEETVASGVAYIQNALFVAKASGYLPEQNELAAAITAAKGGLGSENFATAFEMQRANKLLANDLSALKAIANEQMSDAEKQIEVAQQQLESLQERLEQARIQYENSVNATNAYYDAQLIAAQQQINVLNGINTSVLSVAAATNNLATLMDQQKQATAALAKANADALIAAQQAAARREQELAAAKAAADEKARAAEAAAIAAANAAAERARAEEEARVAAAAAEAARLAALPKWSPREQEIANLYREILGREPDPDGLNFYANISGRSIDAIRKNLLSSPEYRNRAVGGYTSPGMVLVGEEGPELVNFRSPGMVYTSAQTQNLLGGSGGQEIIGELRSLREDQRAQSKALVALQSRMTRIIERWEGDGMPSTRYEGVTA